MFSCVRLSAVLQMCIEMGAVDLAAALERCSGSLDLLQQVCVWESQSVRICAHVQYLVRLLGFSCACACMRMYLYVVCVSELGVSKDVSECTPV